MMEETRYTRKYGGKLNLTLCDPYELCEKRKRIHRDYLAHLFRFYFVGRLIKRGMRILDVGAGTGALAETLYRNMLKPEHYLAVDIKPSHIQKLTDLISKVNFDMSVIKADIRTERFAAAYPEYFDVVCCFEVIEHFESYWDKPEYLTNVLEQMKYAVKPEGVILLSTPNYDGKHKAKNHIYEYTEEELETIFQKHALKVEKKFGTFMSLGRPKQAKQILSECEYEVYSKLYEYYNSSILSVMFAPLHPSESRNILWVLRKR
ncbi:MAG: hypothetical protein DRN26_05790 [Thermoplasmata archaeon]|nr:MAG: hypothetical protein DRN26_05790 [Thermoplasmata archaeon]